MSTTYNERFIIRSKIIYTVNIMYVENAIQKYTSSSHNHNHYNLFLTGYHFSCIIICADWTSIFASEFVQSLNMQLEIRYDGFEGYVFQNFFI